MGYPEDKGESVNFCSCLENICMNNVSNNLISHGSRKKERQLSASVVESLAPSSSTSMRC